MSIILLDISRLISRVGRGPMTGIDRVEMAYFQEMLDRDISAMFLCRVSKGYVLLDSGAGRIILNKIKGVKHWGSRDIVSRFSSRLTIIQQQCQSDLRRVCVAKCLPAGVRRMLLSNVPSNCTYINVGHSNLRKAVFAAVKSLDQANIVVLIHDVIPLDHPLFSRPENVERFRQDMQRVCRQADLIIYNSEWTKTRAESHFSGWGRVPPSIVAHLGVQALARNDQQVVETAPEKSNFVVLGTIEPRKNHSLLLRIWQDFHQNMPASAIPKLHIIGRRGWNNVNVFNILDSDPMMGQSVFEHNNLTDSQVGHRLTHTDALLFPSFAEGFGLPLVEAAQLGVPIICGVNAIYRELLGDYPLYLNVDNSYGWSKEILERAGRQRESEAERKVRADSVNIPDWQGHFDQIFRFV